MEREEAFEFLGINKFRESGYTGSRVKIMSDEKIEENYISCRDKERWSKVICPKGYQTNGSWHGSAVMNISIDICPEAKGCECNSCNNHYFFHFLFPFCFSTAHIAPHEIMLNYFPRTVGSSSV